MTASPDHRIAGRRSLARRSGRWLGALVLVLSFVVCVALVSVFSFEQATLRPLVELLVERATGRALSIEGELDARAGRIVSIRAGGISLANADWGSGNTMLSIDEAEVSVDLLRLLDGMLTLENLMVKGAPTGRWVAGMSSRRQTTRARAVARWRCQSCAASYPTSTSR